jgi:hypothetical protein
LSESNTPVWGTCPSLGVNDQNLTIVSLFPNPTSAFLKISSLENLSIVTIELFDVRGRKVLAQTIKTSERIDVRALSPALYFYKIKDGGKLKKSGKLVIK